MDGIRQLNGIVYCPYFNTEYVSMSISFNLYL